MNSIRREFILYLEDMFLSMQRIEEYISNLDFNKFKMNYMVVDAVVRNFEIIGEASLRIDEDFRLENPQIEWKKLRGFRNRIVHDYFGIDYEIVWSILSEDLEELIFQLEQLLN